VARDADLESEQRLKYVMISFLVAGRFPQLVAEVLAAIRAIDGDGV
jgi:hypothetical protein